MTLEEALGRIADPEAKIFFEKMIKEQNSYITKLETQLKTSAAAPAVAGLDSVTQKYLEKNMRNDVIREATQRIIESFGEDIFKAVKPDWDAFLEGKMLKENTTPEFATDAFNLVLGRCFSDKNHAVHKVGKTTNPTGTPAQASTTNGQAVAEVQHILVGQPPVMTGNDTGAASGLPGTQGVPVKNTKDAFSKLKEKFQNNGGNRFQ